MADNVIQMSDFRNGSTARAQQTTQPNVTTAAEPKTKMDVLMVVCDLEVAEHLMRNSGELLPPEFTLNIDFGTKPAQMIYGTFDVVVLDSGFSGDDINAHRQAALRQKRDLIIFGMRFHHPREDHFPAFKQRLLRNINQWAGIIPDPTPAA